MYDHMEIFLSLSEIKNSSLILLMLKYVLLLFNYLYNMIIGFSCDFRLYYDNNTRCAYIKTFFCSKLIIRCVTLLTTKFVIN